MTPAEQVEACIAEALCHEYHPMHWDPSYGSRNKPCGACAIHAQRIASGVLAGMVADAWDEGMAAGVSAPANRALGLGNPTNPHRAAALDPTRADG